MKKKVTEAIDQAILRLMKTVGAPGAAVAVVQGDEVYTKGYGVKQLGGDDPVDADTLFAGASTTKAFTATAMGMLVDDGKVAWDDPVRRHLPHFRLSDPHADALVTLRDLLCHRTGLPRHDMLWYRSDYSRAEILRRIGFAKLTATFRGAYQYNNICYLAAGEAIKAASGAASWESFLEERVTGPLGMARTHFESCRAYEKDNHAKPHKKIKGKVQTTPFLDFDNCGPGGTINTTSRSGCNSNSRAASRRTGHALSPRRACGKRTRRTQSRRWTRTRAPATRSWSSPATAWGGRCNRTAMAMPISATAARLTASAPIPR
jgi:CubicO group peptidase (beta-lactamase class C family)